MTKRTHNYQKLPGGGAENLVGEMANFKASAPVRGWVA